MSGRLSLLACLVTLISLATGGYGSLGAEQGASDGVVDLPVERSGHVFFAAVTANDKGPFWFTVDTGATHTVLDPETVRALAIEARSVGPRSNIGLGADATEVATAVGVVLRIGSQPAFKPSPLYVVPVKGAEAHLGHRIDGVVGTDFLRQYVVEIDYVAARVRLHQPGATPAGAGARVPVGLNENVLTVRATLTLPDGTTLTPRLLVDTGSSGGLSLNTPFVQAKRLEDVFPVVPGPGLNLRVSVGVGGVTTSRVVSFGSLAIGPVTVSRPDVALSTSSAGLHASTEFDGIIGADILRLFRLVIDYPRRQLAIAPRR